MQYWAEVDCTWLYWALLGCIVLYWAQVDCAGLYLGLMGDMGDMGDMSKEVKEGDKECHTCEREKGRGGKWKIEHYSGRTDTAKGSSFGLRFFPPK